MRTRVHHLLEESAARHPQRPAMSAGRDTRTYEQAWQEVRAVAAGLVDLGVRPGDRVAVFLDKRIETVVSLLAASFAGAAFVPVNPVLKPRQVAHVVGDSGSVAIVTTARRWATLADSLGATDLRHVVLVDEPGEALQVGVSVHAYAALSGADPLPEPSPRPPDGDRAAILYTSGSTGSPKGVVLSHRNLLVGAESVSTYLGNSCRRRGPRGTAPQLRRRAQSGHDLHGGGGPRGARQLPGGP